MDKELKKALERINAMTGNQHGFTVPDGYFEKFDTELDTRMEAEKFPKTSGFETPDHYFEEFETELFAKIAEERLPEETGFIAPENYFDTLENELINTITKAAPKKKLRSIVISMVSSAAAVVLLYIGFNNYKDNTSISFDNLTVTEINAWIQAGNMEVNSYDIAEIDASVFTGSSFIYEDISDEELNDYLDTVDPEYLYN